MLHRLPDEVLHLIFSLTVGPPNPRIVKERTAALLALSRLDRACARVAQQILYADLDLDTSASVTELCAAIDHSPGARRLAFRTRSMRLWGDTSPRYHIYMSTAEALCARCPGVREMWLHLMKLDPLSLSICKVPADLEVLHLNRVTLLQRTETRATASASHDTYAWHLPHLHSLFLTHVTHVDSSNRFVPLYELLTPTSLPAVRTLSIAFSTRDSDPDFGRLAPQLSHLYLRRLATKPLSNSRSTHARVSDTPVLPDLPVADLRSCSAHLRHLAFDVEHKDDFDFLHELGAPSTALDDPEALTSALVQAQDVVFLRSVRLACPRSPTAAERLLLSSDALALDQLAVLTVSALAPAPPANHPSAREWTIARAQRDETLAACEARGIALFECKYRAGSERDIQDEAEERDEGDWLRICRIADDEVELREFTVPEAEREEGEAREEEGTSAERAVQAAPEEEEEDDDDSLIVELVPATPPGDAPPSPP
ncbi:hypothetical protein JCM10207_005736 [Rhodosporidiobolus poonsookiae]